MKKLIIGSALVLLICSCNNTSGDTGTTSNPSTIDTSQQGNGITNAEVTSTDTAAMRVHKFNNQSSDSTRKPATH